VNELVFANDCKRPAPPQICTMFTPITCPAAACQPPGGGSRPIDRLLARHRDSCVAAVGALMTIQLGIRELAGGRFNVEAPPPMSTTTISSSTDTAVTPAPTTRGGFARLIACLRDVAYAPGETPGTSTMLTHATKRKVPPSITT